MQDHTPDVPPGGGSESHANQLKAFLSRDKGVGYFNVAEVFLEGDQDPMKFLARTEISESEIGLLGRRVGDMNSITTGWTNKKMVWNVKYVARQSLNRRSRKEVVAIETGRREERMARGGYVDRMRDMKTPSPDEKGKVPG